MKKLIICIFIFVSTLKIFANKPIENKNQENPQLDTIEYLTFGKKSWMKKNLNVSRFRNGDSIKECRTNQEWIDAGKKKIPAWCYYNNDPKFGEIYGKLYNFFAIIDKRELAPKGWLIPSFHNWELLEKFLGYDYEVDPDNFDYDDRYIIAGKDVGSQLAGTPDLWINGSLKMNPNFCKTLFNALPCGFRDDVSGNFYLQGTEGFWWTKNYFNTNDHTIENGGFIKGEELATVMIIKSFKSGIFHHNEHFGYGYSVRCVKEKHAYEALFE